MIRCPNCGTDNQPRAKFCKMCGSALPVQQPPSPSRLPPSSLPMPRLPTAPQPYTPLQLPIPYPPSSIKPATQVPLSTRLQTAVSPSNMFRGIVVDTPSERRDFPPRDWAKVMLITAILLPILPVLAIGLFSLSVVVCVVALMGAGIITCLLIPLGIMGGFIAGVRGPRRAEEPILELRAQETNSNIINIEMIGRRRGGKIALGDEIEAEGEWADRQQTTLCAWQVRILRAAAISGGGQMSGTVTTDRPWSKPLAQRALAFSIILTLIIYVGVPLVLNAFPGIKGP